VHSQKEGRGKTNAKAHRFFRGVAHGLTANKKRGENKNGPNPNWGKRKKEIGERWQSLGDPR